MMTKTKVVIVGEYPLSEIYSGYLRYIDRLSYYISHIDDIELHVIGLGKEKMQFKKDNLNIHVVKRIFNLPYAFTITIDAWLLRREILKVEPDIVHAIGAEAYSLALLLIRNKYPTVLTMPGIRGKESRFGCTLYSIFGMIVLKPLEKYVVSKIPNIVVEALSIKNLVSEWTKSKIYIVPVGIEFEKMQEIQMHLNENPDIFLAHRLAKIKGIDILLKAVSKVINSISNISVYIAGTGPQENELKSLVKKLNLESNVKFLGFISDEEKYQYYKACKLVVVPSRWDCQPTTLFEAAASGKPVIASDMSNPGIVEDGKTGLIFKSENVEDLADKIITLLKDEKLREYMGKAAKEKAKLYDWSKIAERTVEIYKEVIADFHDRKLNNKKRRKIL